MPPSRGSTTPSSPARESAGPGPLSQQQTSECNEYISQLFHKAALAVVKQRAALGHDPGSGRAENHAFNLELPNVPDLDSRLAGWKRFDFSSEPAPPLVIEFYLDLARLASSQTLVVKDRDGLSYPIETGRGHSSRIVLDRWIFSFERTRQSRPIMPLSDTQGVSLLRSIFSYTALNDVVSTPHRTAAHSVFKLQYRVVDGSAESVDSIDSAGINRPLSTLAPIFESQQFRPIRTPLGTFTAQTRYRKGLQFSVDHTESVLSAQLMNPTEQAAFTTTPSTFPAAPLPTSATPRARPDFAAFSHRSPTVPQSVPATRLPESPRTADARLTRPPPRTPSSLNDDLRRRPSVSSVAASPGLGLGRTPSLSRAHRIVPGSGQDRDPPLSATPGSGWSHHRQSGSFQSSFIHFAQRRDSLTAASRTSAEPSSVPSVRAQRPSSMQMSGYSSTDTQLMKFVHLLDSMDTRPRQDTSDDADMAANAQNVSRILENLRKMGPSINQSALQISQDLWASISPGGVPLPGSTNGTFLTSSPASDPATTATGGHHRRLSSLTSGLETGLITAPRTTEAASYDRPHTIPYQPSPLGNGVARPSARIDAAHPVTPASGDYSSGSSAPRRSTSPMSQQSLRGSGPAIRQRSLRLPLSGSGNGRRRESSSDRAQKGNLAAGENQSQHNANEGSYLFELTDLGASPAGAEVRPVSNEGTTAVIPAGPSTAVGGQQHFEFPPLRRYSNGLDLASDPVSPKSQIRRGLLQRRSSRVDGGVLLAGPAGSADAPQAPAPIGPALPPAPSNFGILDRSDELVFHLGELGGGGNGRTESPNRRRRQHSTSAQ